MSSQTASVVVVGVDGSSLSDSAVRWANRYATATGAKIRIVTAWQWATSYGAPMMLDGYQPNADATVIAEKAKAELTLSEDNIEVVVKEGPAGRVLVDEAKHADVLVVGCQGHTGVSKILLGSVSAYCVHHAACPVVVVR